MLWIALTLCSVLAPPALPLDPSFCGSAAQEFARWQDRCEDAGGAPTQDTDGSWMCVDGDEIVVIDLDN